MTKEINDGFTNSQFPPLVGIREKGNYVKGKVVEFNTTAKNNPVVILELIDLEGSTQISTEKGVYKEVDVAPGQLVQLIGSVKQLKGMIPQLKVGDIVTTTFLGKKKIANGRSFNQFKMIVEE